MAMKNKSMHDIFKQCEKRNSEGKTQDCEVNGLFILKNESEKQPEDYWQINHQDIIPRRP